MYKCKQIGIIILITALVFSFIPNSLNKVNAEGTINDVAWEINSQIAVDNLYSTAYGNGKYVTVGSGW